jgi:hypothetical protein
MNVKSFKRLIKEAVVEAIYEELPDIINEALSKQGKKPLRENAAFSFNSNDVPASPLPMDVRTSLASKMGMEFGFNPSQINKLEVIDAVDESTGDKVNPYLAFIADAANNMSPMDKSGLRNLD